MLKKAILFSTVILIVSVAAFYLNKRGYRSHLQTRQIKHEVDALNSEHCLGNYDIIFQTSQSAQSKAIQLATHSAYSHCGIIHWDGGNCNVWEACNGVTATPIEEFIRRGKGGHFIIKRLKNAENIFVLGESAKSMDSAFRRYEHRPYDIYFGWGDDKLYCSELVWKMYKQATGVELGQLEKLKDFDLSNPIVQGKMRQRYGNNIPMNECVISPVNIFNSDQLVTVKKM